MSNRSKEMLIEGKPLKEWVNAPYGAFGKAVRKELDPNWGADITLTDARNWEVRVDYSYSGRGVAYIEVSARTEKEAEELALKEFDKSDPDMWDADIDDVSTKAKQLK
jgi:hypothetical protein